MMCYDLMGNLFHTKYPVFIRRSFYKRSGKTNKTKEKRNLRINQNPLREVVHLPKAIYIYKKEIFDKRKIQCYNCDECWSGNGVKKVKGNEEEAKLAHENSDSVPVLLMVTTSENVSTNDQWYLGTGCSSHMTGRGEWLMNFDNHKRTGVRLADGRSIVAEGMGDILFQLEDGRTAIIEGVFYVPNMDCNLL